MKFIHITDPHIVPAPRRLCALDPRTRLAAAIDDINRNHGDAAFAVLTGDLAYHGEPAAYEDLRGLLDGLCMACHLLVGNHDDRDNFRRVFPGTPVDGDGFVQYVVETPVGAFIMLDTMEKECEAGVFCARRLAWLDAQLNRYANRPVYLFMHHPPFEIGIASLDASHLDPESGFAKVIGAHGEIKHLFFGHVHRAVAGSWRGIPVLALPGTNHQVGLYLGDAPDMIGTHEPPAYGVVLIDTDRVVVHHRNFLDDSPRFPLMDPAAKQAQSPAELPSLPHALATV